MSLAPDIRIGPATGADLDQIMIWDAQTYQEHQERRALYFPHNEQTVAQNRKLFAAMIDGGVRPGLLVARHGKELVGYVAVRLHALGVATYDPAGKDATIHDIFVHPDWRDQGIAARLLADATTAALAAGALRVSGTAWGGNTASQALFENSIFHEAYRHFEVFAPGLTALDQLVDKRQGVAKRFRAVALAVIIPALVVLALELARAYLFN